LQDKNHPVYLAVILLIMFKIIEFFDTAVFFDLSNPLMQEADEIARIVKEAIEVQEPLLRYQTSDKIKMQAAQRLVDITGLSSLEEWDKLLNK
jgi:hypothetical protein